MLQNARLSLFLSGCVQPAPEEEEKAVIDGWIDSEGYPIVIFTSSIVPGINNTNLAEKIIRWGVVTISDGENTIIMTGDPAEDYFPPYRYVTFKMKGEPGKTYHITADYQNYHAEARCIMPEPTPIKEIRLHEIENNDSLRSAELSFVTPTDVPAYYYITLRNQGESGRFMPTMLGTYKATIPGLEVTVPVLHPKNQLSDSFSSQLKIGEKVEISLCRITPEVYAFWNSYDNAVLFGGTQFFSSTQSLPGNILGGYGIWSAQGVDTVLLDVE